MSNQEPEAFRCPQCGTELAPALLACPGCGRLLHAEELKTLSKEAEVAEQARDYSAALATWRRALELLPPNSRQHGVINDRIAELGKLTESAAVPGGPASAGPEAVTASSAKSRAGGIAGLGALALAL